MKLLEKLKGVRQKQVIILRNDIDMSTGKAIAQACHASAAATRHADGSGVEKKIVVKGDKQTLENKKREAKEQNIPHQQINDAGKTELQSGTATALAIGPAKHKKVDKITGELPTW